MLKVKRLLHTLCEHEERERRDTPSMLFIDSDHPRRCSASPYDISYPTEPIESDKNFVISPSSPYFFHLNDTFSGSACGRHHMESYSAVLVCSFLLEVTQTLSQALHRTHTLQLY